MRRWMRGREFADLHAESVTWLDRHLEVIEGGAPWLHRIGCDVWDFCVGGVTPFLALLQKPGAGARCSRKLTAVYGFDGQLLPLLRSLDRALPPAGWSIDHPGQSWADLDPARAAVATKMEKFRSRWMVDRRVNLTWKATGQLGYPPGGPGTPPWGQQLLAPRMLVTWCSRGQATGWVGNESSKRRSVSGQFGRGHVAVEVSEDQVVRLLDEALDHHEYALTVTIELQYYANPAARSREHRIPRYLLPRL